MELTVLTSTLRLTIGALHKALRKQASHVSSYSMTELETIGLIFRHHRISASELASMTRITTQSMSQILKKFEAQGLIERAASEDDKRKAHISLTSLGEKLVQQSIYERDTSLQKRMEILNKEEIAVLAQALPILEKLAVLS